MSPFCCLTNASTNPCAFRFDFYHLCDYLSAAGDRIGANDKPAWMEEKKNWLKDNRRNDVLQALRPLLEPAQLPDSEAPVRACFRYISNHSIFLDYKGAQAAGLRYGQKSRSQTALVGRVLLWVQGRS